MPVKKKGKVEEMEIKFNHDSGGGTQGSGVRGAIIGETFEGKFFIGGGFHVSGDKSSKGTKIAASALAKKMRAQTSNWEAFGENSERWARKNGIGIVETIPWTF